MNISIITTEINTYSSLIITSITTSYY